MDPWEQILVKIESKYINFYQENYCQNVICKMAAINVNIAA